MRKKNKIISLISMMMLFLNFSACDVISRTEESINNKVLAKVDNVKITRGELDQYMSSTLKEYEDQYGEDFDENEEIKDELKEVRTRALQKLIERQILFNIEEELNIEYSEEEIEEYISNKVQAIKDYAGDGESYKNYLTQYGYTEKSFEKYLREDYIIAEITKKLVEDVSVSEEEIEEYYNENESSFKLEPGAYISHILFKDKITGYEESLKARELYLQGSTFEDIVSIYNNEDVCITEDMKHQPYAQESSKLVKAFVNGFKDLSEGEISQPIETSFGWHLIVAGKTNKETITQNLKDVKDEIKETLLSEKRNEEYKNRVNEYQDKMDIKVYKDRY